MWQLFILGLNEKTSVLTLDEDHPENLTVLQLKDFVSKITGVVTHEQRLIYSTSELHNEEYLSNYPHIKNGSTISLVSTLKGGGNYFGRSSNSEVCMITREKENVHKMSCGHFISTEGLMSYCMNEIGKAKCEINCPECQKVWSLKDIKQCSGNEADLFHQVESGLSLNYCRKHQNIRECPACGTFCERLDTTSNSVECIACSKAGRCKHFCWICLRSWKNHSLTAKDCGNSGCSEQDEKLQRLKQSPRKSIYFLDVKIYELRACPKCFTLIEHIDGCKHMTCSQCKTKFCFVCLCCAVNSSFPCGSYNEVCELAPIQDHIPKRDSML